MIGSISLVPEIGKLAKQISPTMAGWKLTSCGAETIRLSFAMGLLTESTNVAETLSIHQIHPRILPPVSTKLGKTTSGYGRSYLSK